MQEDTKPEKDDIQEEARKKPFSRSEYHGVITSYAGLVLSLIAIILSVITMYQSHIMETREIVQILRAEDDGYYHFDGETLFKNFQVTVANNSAIPVSVVEITIKRGEETRTFKIADLPDILPLNMESNHTEMITIPWNIPLSKENAQIIQYETEEIKSDAILSSRFVYPNGGTGDISSVSPVDIVRPPVPSSGPGGPPPMLGPIVLSVTARTAKNNQHILTTVDIGAPELGTGEVTWVTNQVARQAANQAALSQLFGIGDEGFIPLS